MSSQLGNKSDSEFRNPITTEERKNFVISFIRKHPGCSKHAIYKSKENKDYGARETLLHIIEILEKEGAIQINHDENRNLKRLHLFLVNENPLTFIPDQLLTLEKLFEKFTNDLGNIYSRYYIEWPSQKFSPIPKPVVVEYRLISSLGNMPTWEPNPNYSKEYMDFLLFQKRIIRNVIQIPFAIIDIIYSSIKYLQRLQWMDLDEKISTPLNQILYSKMNNLNLIASKMAKKINKEPYNQDLLDEKAEYFITFENSYERYSILERICVLRHACKSIGLGNQLDSILRYLIEKNPEYFEKRFFLNENSHFKKLAWSTKDKLDAIHQFYCPAIKNNKNKKDENMCLKLDKDPTFPYF